jgi:hypothetical protein
VIRSGRKKRPLAILLHSLFSRVSRHGASFPVVATEGYFSFCIVAPVEQISELLVRSRHNECEYSPELRGFEQSAIMIYEARTASSAVNGEGGIDGGAWSLGLRADLWSAPRIETHYSSQPDSFVSPTGMVRCVNGFDTPLFGRIGCACLCPLMDATLGG